MQLNQARQRRQRRKRRDGVVINAEPRQVRQVRPERVKRLNRVARNVEVKQRAKRRDAVKRCQQVALYAGARYVPIIKSSNMSFLCVM